MSQPLASADISDSDLLAAVKSLAMPAGQRAALWQERWARTSSLQAEFGEARFYAALMEGELSGRVHRIHRSHAATEREQANASDQRLIGLARAAGWNAKERIEHWTARYGAVLSLQAEFASAEQYVTFIEGHFKRAAGG